MKEITAYKTTDGEVFEEIDEAKNHQSILNLKESLENSRFYEYLYRGMDIDTVRDLMIENRDELKKLFNS